MVDDVLHSCNLQLFYFFTHLKIILVDILCYENQIKLKTCNFNLYTF